MKAVVASALLFFSVPALATDWSAPPVATARQMIPLAPDFPCLDLTGVANPQKDLPPLSEEEQRFWTVEHKRELRVCRAREVLRREPLGTVSEALVEWAWMTDLGVRRAEEKLAAIEESSREHGIPEQILVGAFMQESLLAELGISDDGGNYSCGVGQVNLLEWCRWAESLPAERQDGISWPRSELAAWRARGGADSVCSEPLLSPGLVSPFHRLALSRLRGEPAYRLRPEHFSGVRLEDVVPEFPAGPSALQELRFAGVMSFVRNCSLAENGIAAKAHELGRIFSTYVPEALRSVQLADGRYYPLHTGWLLADAIYNAGPGIVTAISWYLGLDPARLASRETWRAFTPVDLIEALYWAGKYNTAAAALEYRDFDGSLRRHTYFKACVVQRHVARVVQYASLPGVELARSLEGELGCRKIEKDSAGRVIRSNVPLERQRSSGRK